MQLKGKVAVVTGAGSGFGAEIARVYGREGAKLIVADINDNAGNTVARESEDGGGQARFVHADVTSREDTRAMIQAAIEAYGRIDILVNNAGYSHKNRPMMEVSEEDFDRCYEVNVKSIYHAAMEAVPLFRKQGGGCIINTSSTAGLRPRPGLTWYNSSKGAVNILTKSMAVELAPDRIRVNAICPVMGETGLLETFMGMPDTPENRKKFEATIPLGRMSKPGDIANAALFLALDSSEFLTGLLLEVDGGRCI